MNAPSTLIKNPFKTGLKACITLLPLTFLLFQVSCQAPPAASPELVIFPSPGDLSAVEGLQESKLFDVSVNGRDTFVYHGFEKEYNKYGFARKGGHFVSFGFANQKPEIVVSTQSPILSYTIKPALKGTASKTGDEELSLILEEKQKFLVTIQFEEGEDQWLIISAEAPPPTTAWNGSPETLVLGPGVHDYGRSWDPFTNGVKSLVIEGGAVVTATLRVVDKEGISISGNGLFAQAFRPHGRLEDPLQTEWMSTCMGAYFRDCKDVNLEGYAVINSPSYQLELANCEDVVIRNLKLLGFGENNNDGAHLYSRRVLMEDCFIAGNDDRICITGLYDSEDREIKEMADQQKRITGCAVGDITIRDIVFWGHRNGGDIMLTWNGAETCENIRIENVTSLLSNKGGSYKGFLAAMHGGSVVVRDVEIRNATLDHGTFLSILVNEASMWGAGGGAIRDVLLENITIAATPETLEDRVGGTSKESNVANFTFRNVTLANGEKMTSLEGTGIEVGDFVENFIFEQ